MKFRSTLILLLLLAAMATYWFAFERHHQTTQERLKNESQVVELDRDKIDSISIRSPDTKVELRKQQNNQWVLEEPVKDRADATVVTELLTAAEGLHSDAALQVDPKDKEKLKEYGVVESTTKVKFSGNGKSTELQIGKDAAIEGKTYVYVDGATHVHAIGNNLKTLLTKKADDFRDRKLADVSAQQVIKVEVKSTAGLLELTKTNNHWSISKPLQARGDDSKINDLLAQALTAHIDEFVTEKNAADSGLGEPRGTLSLTVEGAEKPVILSYGQNPKEEKDKEKTYVKLSSRDAVVLVPKSVEKILETKPNDVRDKNLLRVESDIVDRMTIEPAGADKITLARKGESWVQKIGKEDKPINDAVPQRVLSDLQGAQVVEFVSDVATELPKYGLDQPSLKVTFSSYASENTAETSAGEKPIVTVLFGHTDNDRVFAKLDNEPFVVAVPATVLNGIPTTTIQLQDPILFKDKPEDISALEIAQPAHGSMSLERDKEAKWKLTKGDGTVIQANAQAIANSMATLRAVRWLGPAKPEYGLEQPTAVVTATLGAGEKKAARKLTIGAVGKDEVWAATVDGKEGVFALSRIDLETLTRPLTTEAAAAAAATPPVTAPGAATPPGVAPADVPPPPSIAPAPLVTPLGQQQQSGGAANPLAPGLTRPAGVPGVANPPTSSPKTTPSPDSAPASAPVPVPPAATDAPAPSTPPATSSSSPTAAPASPPGLPPDASTPAPSAVPAAPASARMPSTAPSEPVAPPAPTSPASPPASTPPTEPSPAAPAASAAEPNPSAPAPPIAPAPAPGNPSSSAEPPVPQ